jgi:DNA adenine methylase
MDEDQHRELADAANQCKGKVAVSGYDHPLMAKLFARPRWRKMASGQKTTHSVKTTRQEVLWMNY